MFKMFHNLPKQCQQQRTKCSAHKTGGRSQSNQNSVCHICKNHKQWVHQSSQATAAKDQGPDSFKLLLSTMAPSPWCSQCWFLLILLFLTLGCNLLPVSYMVWTYVSYYSFLRKTSSVNLPTITSLQYYLQRHGGESCCGLTVRVLLKSTCWDQISEVLAVSNEGCEG